MPDFDKIQLNVERDGKNIFGVVYIPRGDNGTKRYPTIIYSHGMSSNHESGDKYAAEFARRASRQPSIALISSGVVPLNMRVCERNS